MGTSTILKINIKKICDSNGIDAIVESCAFSEAMTYLMNTDIIITSPEWADMMPTGNADTIRLKNLMDTEEIEKNLIALVKEKYPNEIR